MALKNWRAAVLGLLAVTGTTLAGTPAHAATTNCLTSVNGARLAQVGQSYYFVGVATIDCTGSPTSLDHLSSIWVSIVTPDSSECGRSVSVPLVNGHGAAVVVAGCAGNGTYQAHLHAEVNFADAVASWNQPPCFRQPDVTQIQCFQNSANL
jgi:hypothetical protein